MTEDIARALEDLEIARRACLATLDDPHLFGPDRVKAAAELRLIAKERLGLLERRRQAEADAQQREQLGPWA